MKTIFQLLMTLVVMFFVGGTERAMASCLTIVQDGTSVEQALVPGESEEKPRQEQDAQSDDFSQPDTVFNSTVGFPKQILQHKIAGAKVIVKPITDKTLPVIVRIIETFPHGSDFRYDLEYKGLEPGEFDVANYLMREDGTDVAIPPMMIQIDALLAPEVYKPSKLANVRNRFYSFYFSLLVLLGIVWVVGLFTILFYGRKRKPRPASQQKPITVAERMRPLVNAAIAGGLTAQEQAELERLLSAHWSKKLNLGDLPADELRRHLRTHPEASIMLNQIDSWLHRPKDDPANQVDVNELLKPYSIED